MMDGGRGKTVQVNSSDTVASLYQKASEILGLQLDGFALHLGSSILREDRRLIHYEMHNQQSVIVVIRVHGGLWSSGQ